MAQTARFLGPDDEDTVDDDGALNNFMHSVDFQYMYGILGAKVV